MKKTILRGLGVILMALALMLPAMSQASADQTGGGIGGGCGNGCSVAKNAFHWSGYPSDRTVKNGYAKFKAMMLQETGGRQTSSYIDSRVNSGSSGRVPGGVSVCQDSDYVWALTINASNKWGWASAITFATHGSSWPSNQGTIESPWRGVAPKASTVANFKKWDKDLNGNQIDKNPGYIIICSGASDPYVPPVSGECTTNCGGTPAPIFLRTFAYPEIRMNEVADETHPYSCSVTAEPQITDASGNDPIGANNLNTQTVVQKTNWGRLVDLWNKQVNDGNVTYSQYTVGNWQVLMDEAVEDDGDNPCPKITLNEDNKKGMAEGGVMNFTERTQSARLVISTSSKFIERIKTETMQYWNPAANRYNAPVVTLKETIPWNVITDSTYENTTYATLKDTGFWQMIAVHCNKADFDKLMLAVPTAKRVSTGDATGLYSNTATSQKYNARPSKVDFGDPSSTNAAIKASASLGFFDKECPFSCTSVKTGTGATTANGATTNLNNGVPAGFGATTDRLKYGAVSDTFNANNFEFFRDNTSKQIKLDVWYPQSGGVVSYDGHAPLNTTINRWGQGTPNSDQFKLNDQTGKSVFNESVMQYNEKNWTPATSQYQTKNSTKVRGLHRDFTTSSFWVTETDKPQVLNFKWGYAPNVSTVFPSTNLGFNANGTANYGTNTTLSTAIQGKCYANFGTTTSGPEEALTQQNTGSGVSNDLDGRLFQEAKAGALTNSPNDVDKKNLFIKFVRATGE